jgi:hypothetical protein
MKAVLSKLEPRYELAHVILFNELDEVDEVCFFNYGQIDVGFEINRKQYFELRLRNSVIVGAYNVSFNKRSKYIYRTHTYCEGYTIRKTNWHIIMSDEEHSLLGNMLKKRIKREYQINTDWKIASIRKSMIDKWKRRADYEATLMMQEHGPEEPHESSQEEDEKEDGLTLQLEELNSKFDKYGGQVQNFIGDFHKQGDENLQLRLLLQE